MGKDSLDLFGAPREARVVPVMVPLPVAKPYSYVVPDGMHVEAGSIVQVPLGPRQVFGVVWAGES
ncbi:MAG: primosomal protein, partial [Pseudomonadota bacterium]